MSRKTIALTLEALTPLFLSGADQEDAEIRVPSLRGVMRYWFRAMMGGILGGNVQEIRKYESKVWGETQQASQVSIRLTEARSTAMATEDLDQAIPRGSRTNLIGRRYLLYSTLLHPGNKYQRPKYIKEGACFTFEIGYPQSLENLVLGTLWLVGNFGSLGTRARRGLGAIRISNPTSQTWDGAALPWLAANPNEHASCLQAGLQKVKSAFMSYLQRSSSPCADLPEFPCFLPNCCRILVLNKPFISWCDALDWLGTRYARYRATVQIEEREGFGLPIVRRGSPSLEGRRASPLFVRPFLMKASEESERPSLGLMVLFFKSQFICQKGDRSAVKEPRGNYQVAEKFLEQLNNESIEVRLDVP